MYEEHYIVEQKPSSKLRILKWGLLLFLFLVLALIYFTPKPSNPGFSLRPPNDFEFEPPEFESSLIPQPAFLASSHSATLEVLPNGDLIAFWFSGSHEGKPDVKIWQSIYNQGEWSFAVSLISPGLLSDKLDAYVRKVGNPLVYLAKNGKLHLFVVSVAIGGWAGSTINHLISNNDGKTWRMMPKLIVTPFFNLSTLVRTKPVTLADGGFYLPVYHELMYTYPLLLRFDNMGNFIDQIRVNSEGDLLQPSMVPLTTNEAVLFLRNNKRRNNELYRQTTIDGGETWSPLLTTGVANQDSSLVVSELPNYQLLMVHNINQGRGQLALSISNDQGKTWKLLYLLENQLGEEYSYPAIQVHKDMIDILYTWQRHAIKHVRFNMEWLIEKENKLK